MQIPQSDILSTNAMNRVFDTTTATYKFYWLLALLDMYVKEQKDEMRALDVAARKVAYAWYPTQYFRLSFGKGDSMSKIIPDVALLTGITVDDRLEDKSEAISNAISEDREVKKRVKILLNNVPFRFQKPWIDTTDDSEMQRRSQSFENNCLYSLTGSGEGLMVTINPRWSNYLTTNYEVLRDFALWNLTLFLQSKNPNVPNISGKLLRPEERESLTRQKKFWNKVIEIGGPIRCIYKDTPLGRNEYDLDHFIPWSFVSHNQNWNLIPADSSFNSSKSNLIPDLYYYLPKMAKVQHKALRLYIPQSGKRDNTLDEYYALGYSPQDLMQMSDEQFLNVLEPYAQAEVLMNVANLLSPNGTAYFAVRRDLTEEGFRLHAIHKQYTYQCNVKLPYKSLVANKSYELYQYNHFNKLPCVEGEKCPFCRLSRRVEIICETATCVAFYDGYPVSPGHALIIPKRHVASYFDLTNHEREAMNVVLQYVKQKIDERFHPDGYNVGINVGEAAGQSVFHCHMHVIPRYKGDVPNPKGGVHGVIPQKQKY